MPNTEASEGELPFFIVLNAGSGRRDPTGAKEAIAGVLEEAGRRFEFLLVERPDQLTKVAREATRRAEREGGAVIVAGGDGTISSVAAEVLPSGRPFGVIPRGTFNYFGRAHGISEDASEATRSLLDAEIRPNQVGLLGERVFLVNASLGLYPELLEEREEFKQRFGRSRLVAFWAALWTLLREHRQLVLEFERDGVRERLRTPTLVVENNRLQLEQLGIDEVDALEAGELPAITVGSVGSWGLFWLLVRGAFGRLGDAENVHTFSFRRLEVRPGLPWGPRRLKVALDGEVHFQSTPLVFSVAPDKLQLLVPRARSEKEER